MFVNQANPESLLLVHVSLECSGHEIGHSVEMYFRVDINLGV